ncbi:alpha-galactosidase [Tropicibacter oceani]|uniref:alpha-galactosidase n=1 Tax=Tropicibacter oceani TaxID=3058420 RepID=A0ABY8QNM6_9RHOB|nr:alpha-galactosidase [Tropicibacter oceani]WGW05626.1 alpha-galactosidase [Tropicibacter oceani]
MTTYRIDTTGQTLVFAEDGGLPCCLYWGPTLPESEDLGALAQAAGNDITGGMLDALPPLSILPEASRSFPGQPGLIAYRDGLPLYPGFKAAGERRYRCDATGLTLFLEIKAENGVVTLAHRLEADTPITLHHLAAPVLPGPQSGEILHFSGRWIGEFLPQRAPWQPGMLKREARTGRSGHEHPPLAFFLEDSATNTAGTAFGMHLAYPGGHVMIAEELPDGRRQIQWGKATGTQTTGTEFHSADLLLTLSDKGLNGCATAFQRHIRDAVVTWPDPDRPRPVHYNCWEAVYFDHDLPTLKDIATRAAALGAERFVLDDGWFGRRDDDTSSLGDWQIDPRKWPDGLTPLIEHVQSEGMTFGLWVEPEMVNLNSDLARAHPDWILGPKDQIEGRQQRVLDLSLPEVREYLFDALDAILSSHDIDYLKWDHNRLLPIPDAAQADGILDLLWRLRAAHPQTEIESCASGGGRIDAGILRHTHRVWLSDSNDAIERLCIQHDAALLLPAAVTGSHVGPRQCHTSGRIIPMAFRAWVAAQRHMGFEMDPRELTEDEAETLKQVTTWWKENRHWTMSADILRLDSFDPAVTAEMQLAQDKSRFVLFAGQSQTSAQILPRPLRLTGLDPQATYRVSLLNKDEAHRLSRGAPALKSAPLTLSGAALMTLGLTLPWRFAQTMWVLEGHRLEGDRREP